jgi:transposase
MSRAMPHQKVNDYMRDKRLTPILKALIASSAAPLKSVETKFAIDSSGFGSSKFERWYDQKYGRETMKSVWVKVHLCCGVTTNVVTAVRILDKDAADSPQFAPLVTETRKTFTISEVSADKAYTSLENFEHVAGFGGVAYMPFKSNATGARGGMFEKMFHYFKFQHETYMSHYHLRSNVESTFSMVKRKFGDSVRSKDDTGMVNEVLCKVLAHNLCVLNLAECELGIESVFTANEPKPQLALMA